MPSKEQASERRHFTRFAFDAASVIKQNGEQWPATLFDISLKGALLKLEDGCTIDFEKPVDIEITLDNDHHISMQLLYAHQEGELIGFNCQQIDIDSITLLKRLAELNLGDHQLLERELDALTHI